MNIPCLVTNTPKIGRANLEIPKAVFFCVVTCAKSFDYSDLGFIWNGIIPASYLCGYSLCEATILPFDELGYTVQASGC